MDNNKTKTIKELSKVDRPREKLIKYGPEKLSNSELLAILLRIGTKDKNAVELATSLLKKYSSKSLPEQDIDELTDQKGVGEAKASQIVACFELSKRLLQDKQATLFLKPKDVFHELADIRKKKKEYFVVFYLDPHNQEVKREVISIGSLEESVVHPREVYEPAVRHTAAQIMVAHNHPSGKLEPSRADIKLTERLQEAGEILGIELIDHIIVTKDDYLSMKKEDFL